ncbi:MAG: monooxygenase FAD-binding protein [Pseudonocardia sp.]|jgi:2-polyprenyl-6-methoxyphenol hydroxylase-like FAD-dependent oxidoreductase|nr:monooxygenase FAD-binding protein [Pseudonocardia sp.]
MTAALVIGAGIAGPVAAMALQRVGVEATVLEAGPGPADDIGAFLTLQINGIDALRAIEADGAVTGLGFPTPSMRFRSGSGKVLGEISTGEPLADGTVGITMRRADLYRALCDEALRRGIRIERGRRLVDARPVPGGVLAEFADGSTATADLLIGADGIRSRVRQIIDPAAAPARYVPVLNIGGYAPPQDTGARPGEYEMVFGRRAFFGFLVAPEGAVWWFANPPRRDEPARGELAAMSTAEWRSWLLELFAPDRTPASEIIRSTPGELVGWTTYDLPSVRTWHRDRMIVIGDAAHATSPASGQGASMAVEDAVELARCLRDLPEPAAAFTAYDRLRRARVEKVVAAGARTSNSKAAGPVGRVLRDAFLPLVLSRAGRQAQSWLHEYHIDWDAPVGAGGNGMRAR